MKNKWIIRFIIVVVSCLAAFFGLAQRDYPVAAGDGSEKIESTLVDRISTDGSADFIVRFTEQADLSAAYSMDWEARGEFVYNTLRETAERSQVDAKAALNEQGLTYQTFIAGNELYVWGTQQAETNGLKAANEVSMLNQLAALPEVSSIRATRTYSIDPVVEAKPFENISWAGDLLAYGALTTVVDSNTTATVDWGITDTKADQFWTAFGIQGDGIVVANIDTGVQWNHPALIQEFNCGANPADPKCWKDPSNICGAAGACDNNGHGTHTMGTMVGSNDPSLAYNVGMAPDAKWIACKGCESSSCSDLALNACADWILAPGGSVANRPNIVNNSWGGGIGGGGNDWYLPKVQAWRAAGIFPVFAAGNTGSSCGSLESPGDYQESFGIAAHNSSRIIASFSSRGPSAFGDSPYTKPNISAPGVNILSTYPTNTWIQENGTSMASPHTAGAVALLWSCNRALIGQMDATFQLLQNNADTAPGGSCGAPSVGQDNYTYGYGYLDALAAGNVTCSMGILTGHVQDQTTNPLSGVSIRVTPNGSINQIQALTNASGNYSINLSAGTYTVTATKVGYALQSKSQIVVTDGGTTTVDFTLGLAKSFYLPAVFNSIPNWETLVNTTFEGDFPGPWAVFDNDATTHGEYFWASRNCRPYAGTNSAWAVGGGVNGNGLSCGSNYPDYMDSWMQYGPFSLVNATAAELVFKLWSNNESDYDGVCRMASIDGINFYGICTSGNSAGWIDRTLDLTTVYTLGDLRGHSQVWVALVFTSDSLINYPEGAYVDNIVLRRCMTTSCTGSIANQPEAIGSQIVELTHQETIIR